VRITIAMGFFLPVPPVAGGAVEKSWHELARAFARRGHAVTLISRRWSGWPDAEVVDGVQHLRVPGFRHRSRLAANLLLDLVWSWRVFRRLPPADIVVVNAVALGCWLGALRADAGRVVLMPGRQPKGQFRWYRRPARILVPSSPVGTAVTRERPSFASLIRVVGYPIDWSALASGSSRNASPVTIGFVGRLHREKGLDILCAAARELARTDLPDWRLIICGPVDVAQGGSGQDFLNQLRALAPNQVEFRAPVFSSAELARLYQSFDIFCYPSIAAQGETFGVAVAEAMAAGAVPIVSDLPCFGDFVQTATGLTFSAAGHQPVADLAASLAKLIRDEPLRRALGRQAQEAVKRFDCEIFAQDLLTDFEQLTRDNRPSSSQT